MTAKEVWERFKALRSIGIEVPSPCVWCQNFIGFRKSIPRCKAFPEGIPPVIFAGRVIHDTPVKGQKGEYVFKSR